MNPYLVFAFQAAVFTVVFLWQLVRFIRFSRFEKVPGRVIESQVTGQAYLIAYEYSVAGRREIGGRLHSLNTDLVLVDDRREMRRLQRFKAQFPLGAEITVKHHPAEPSQSYLRNGPVSEVLVPLAIAAVFALITAYGWLHGWAWFLQYTEQRGY